MRNIKLIGDGELYHFNPYHDKLGRFASKNNSGLGLAKNSHQYDKNRKSNLEEISSSIHDKYQKIEPKITRDVANAIQQSDSKVYGIKNKIKTLESLTRKIKTDAIEQKISIEQSAKNINDILRYTSLSDDNKFLSSYNQIKKKLDKKGYKEIKCKNYFDMYEKGLSKHKQVTSVFQDNDGNKFEIQFQTPSSIKAKELKTPLYEELRRLDTNKKRKKELIKQMEKLAEKVNTPKDVNRILTHSSVIFFGGERTMQLVSNDELYHFNPWHDELGRFASKAAGAIKNPSKVKKNLLNNYYKRDEATVKKYLKKKGYSEAQINRQLSKRRENRKKMLKRAAIIAGGLTLAATSYYMYKHVGHKYMNDIIKSGTAMQTVHDNADRLKEGNLFYTTPQKEGDAYIGLFGENKLFGLISAGNKNKITYNFSKDKKIASIHESKKIFDNMMKEPEMKSMFKSLKKDHSFLGRDYVGYLRGYDYFNRIGMMLDDDDDPRVKKFKSRFIDDTLKAGFDGIKDLNDIKNGMSDHPYIILNKDGIQNVKSALLSDSEIRNKKYINIAKILGKNTIKTYYPFIIAGGGAYGLAVKNNKYDKNIEQKIKGEKK